MGKFVKGAAVALAVLVASALAAPTLFRGEIADLVRREAGKMLSARLDVGRIDISLLRHFPNASVEIERLVLTGTGCFEGDTIASARRISLVVAPFSLFGDDGPEVKKLLLSAPSVHARKLADGSVNWDVVKASEKARADEPSVAVAPASASFRLAVRDFRISDAAIRYEDDSTRVRFSTGPLSLRLRGDLAADEAGLDVSLRAGGTSLSSAGVPLLSGAEAAFDARIDADLAGGRYVFSHNTLRLNAVEMELDGWTEFGDGAVEMDVAAGCERVEFKDLLSLVPAFYTRDFRDLTAEGELSMALWARGRMHGPELPAFECRVEVRDGGFRYSSLPEAAEHIALKARVANPGGVMDRTTVDLSECSFRMAGNEVSAEFHASHLASDPFFRAAVDGEVDFGTLRRVYPFEKGSEPSGRVAADVRFSGCMSDIEHGRYGRIGASGTFVVEELGLILPQLPAVHIRRAAATVTPEAMTLGECGMTVGRSDLSANGRLSGYLGYLLHGDALSGRLYVKSGLLDLNELLAAASRAEASDSKTAAGPTDSAKTRAVEVPRNLDLSFRADLDTVLFGKMRIVPLSGEMRAREGVLSLDRLGMGLFGGRASARGSYSATADPQRPELALRVEIADASFSRTFEELETARRLVPVFARTGGVYSLGLDLKTALDAAMNPELPTLDASGELRSANVRLGNIEAFDMLAEALDNDALRRIEARDVNVRFAVRGGRVYTQPFDLKMGDVNVRLSGSTGLDETIAYTAKVALPAGLTGGVLESVGVNIGGTFSSPKITLGVREAVEEAVKSIVGDGVERFTGGKSLSETVSEHAEQLREEARKAGEALIRAARTQRDRLVESASEKGMLAKLAAEKAGDKLVEEAGRQAANLVSEAERQIGNLSAENETKR